MSKHQIHPEYGEEQTDAGRDGRTRLATKFSGANGYREILIFPVQLTTSITGNLTRLIYTNSAICDGHKDHAEPVLVASIYRLHCSLLITVCCSGCLQSFLCYLLPVPTV